MKNIDDLALILITLIGIRSLAFILFAELYLRLRANKYAVLTAAWFLYFLAPCFGLYNYLSKGYPYHPFFAYFAALGTVLFMISLFLYYKTELQPLFLTLFIISAVSLFILIGLHNNISGLIANTVQFIFITATVFILLFKNKWFLEFGGGSSYFWLISILILSIFHTLGFNFIYPETALSIRFMITALVNISLIIFFLHFDSNYSLICLENSEKQYKALFDLVPVVIIEGDISRINNEIQRIRSLGISDISNYFLKSPSDLKKIIEKLDILSINKTGRDLFNVSDESEFKKNSGKIILEETLPAAYKTAEAIIDGALYTTTETVIGTFENFKKNVILNIKFSDQPQTVIITLLDISEKRLLESELHQSEKMNAVGQLTGGIAHDFNNQLGGILGYADLIKCTDDNEEIKKYAEHIITSAGRAADLTSKLLSFGRKGERIVKSVDLHDIIMETVAIAERSLDKKIKIWKTLDAGFFTVSGDPSQLQNAILNIVINARDAMPDGGVLTVSTDNFIISRRDNDKNKQYIKISISDTGTGIPTENMDKIFEPFFTTKENGKGTGMGLASVYATVKEHYGLIKVHSVPEKGSRFEISLPVHKESEL